MGTAHRSSDPAWISVGGAHPTGLSKTNPIARLPTFPNEPNRPAIRHEPTFPNEPNRSTRPDRPAFQHEPNSVGAWSVTPAKTNPNIATTPGKLADSRPRRSGRWPRPSLLSSPPKAAFEHTISDHRNESTSTLPPPPSGRHFFDYPSRRSKGSRADLPPLSLGADRSSLSGRSPLGVRELAPAPGRGACSAPVSTRYCRPAGQAPRGKAGASSRTPEDEVVAKPSPGESDGRSAIRERGRRKKAAWAAIDRCRVVSPHGRGEAGRLASPLMDERKRVGRSASTIQGRPRPSLVDGRSTLAQSARTPSVFP